VIGEPDLNRPGNPRGTEEQTVWDNCMELADAVEARGGKVEDVNRERCESAGIDWRDWGYFMVAIAEEERWTDLQMLEYETNYENTYGVPAPGFAELRARMKRKPG